MARIKTVCLNCGNIMMAGNGTDSSGDYADIKLIYIKMCSECPSRPEKKSGCTGIVILVIALIIALLF